MCNCSPEDVHNYGPCDEKCSWLGDAYEPSLPMQCSPCGYVTHEIRASNSCAGRCGDPGGGNCNAWPCPNCGAVHAWTGSIDQGRAHTDDNRALRQVLGEALSKHGG